MVKSKIDKKKQKRAAKKKQVQASRAQVSIRVKGRDHLEDARYFYHTNRMDQAVISIQKAAKALPNDEEAFSFMGHIAVRIKDAAMELFAMAGLERMGKITDEMRVDRVFKLYSLKRYSEAVIHADLVLNDFTQIKIKNKRRIKEDLQGIKTYCQRITTSFR